MYETIAYSKRRELHNKIAHFIETRFKDILDEYLGILSYHYYHAHNWESAFYYSLEAAERAKNIYANEEALKFYDRALETFNRLCKQGYHKKLFEYLKSTDAATIQK